METETKQAKPKKESPDQLGAVAPWFFAGIILIGYIIFIVFLIGNIGLGDESWIKLTHILGSIEAIVFTAVGFIFGAEVNRTRATTAERKIEEVKKEKNELATEILNKIPPPPITPTTQDKQNELADLRFTALKYLK